MGCVVGNWLESLEGSLVAGKYRLKNLIGSGGMGAVLEGVHEVTGRHVAVKLLTPELREHPKAIKRFVQMRLWPDVTLRIVACHVAEEKARKRLADMADYCYAHGLEPEAQYLPESPGKAILAHAVEWDADLVVLGNSVRSFVMRKIFGETALDVMQHSDRPLFLSH